MGRLLMAWCLIVCGSLFVTQDAAFGGRTDLFSLQSPAFVQGKGIPVRHTCQGDDVSPALLVSGIPQGTKTLALIVDDPDAPMGTWVHWVVFNIPPVSEIVENSVPGTLGANDFGRLSYGGPCPPSGTHRYFFRLYAVDTVLSLKEGISKAELEQALQGHIVSTAELMGTYRQH